jgi:hypothetical protein
MLPLERKPLIGIHLFGSRQIQLRILNVVVTSFQVGLVKSVEEVHQIFLVERRYTPNDVLRHLWEGIRRKRPDKWWVQSGSASSS